MSYLVIMIVDEPDDCPDILNGWQEAGVTGVTILESTGLGRLQRGGFLDNLPIMPSLRDLMAQQEEHHRTLLSVVEDKATVDKMVDIVNNKIGCLDEPHTGFLFVVPVLEVHGFGNYRKN